MKLFKIAFPLLLLFFYLDCFCQTAEPKKQLGLIVKADVLMPVVTQILSQIPNYNSKEYNFSLALEKQLEQRQSIQLTGMYSYINLNLEPGTIQYKTVSITPEYKFFILKNKPITGPYLGGYSAYRNEHFFSIEESYLNGPYDEYIIHIIGVGIITGYQCYIKNKIVIDFLAGLGVNKEISIHKLQSINNSSTPKPTSYLNLDGRLAINIGYKF
jgi:hypothetical protein